MYHNARLRGLAARPRALAARGAPRNDAASWYSALERSRPRLWSVSTPEFRRVRFLAAAVMACSLLVCADLARAASRTSTGDGAWCAAETWDPPGTPGSSDRITIAQGHHVTLEGGCAQAAADLTIESGALSSVGGQVLTVGDPIASYAIRNEGTIELSGGDRLEIDCDAVDTTNCEVANVAGGLFRARGVRLGSGVVTAVTGENCPANSDFLPEAPFQAADCTDVSIDVDGLGGIEDGDARFVGRYIRFGWPSAHRGTWYRIVGASAPSRLVLDYNSEGQQAARGIGPSSPTATATVAQGSTTVIWPSGLEGADARASLGAWFVCDADCPAVSNDSPFAGASSERLPCSSARRIADVPVNEGRFSLVSGYPSASCSNGAAARIIGSSASTGRSAVEYVERFAAGDPFVVWNPVTLTVPEANKQFAPVQSKTGAGLRFEDDSVVDLEGVRISFWGRGDAAFGLDYDPIESRFTGANTTGALYLRQVEISHFGGGEAVKYKNIKNGLGANEDVTARDPLPTDLGADPSRGHGLWINRYEYPGGDGIVAIVGWRGTRLGDDCIVVNGDSTSAPNRYQFARITLDHPTCTFASTLGQQPSAQCLDFQDTDLMLRDGVDILAPLCSNFHNGGLMWVANQTGATASGRWLVSDGVFQNLQDSCVGAPTNADYNAFRVLVVNSLCRSVPAFSAQPGASSDGIVGADVFSSYVADGLRGIAEADVVRGAFIRLGRANGATGLYTGSSRPWFFTSSDQSYEDVAVTRTDCPPDLSCGWARGFDVGTHDSLTSDLSLLHGTFAGLASSPGGVAWQTSDNPTALAVVRDSVVWDIRDLFIVQGTSGNLTESHNLFVDTPNFCTSSGGSCPPQSATTLSTGVIAVRSSETDDLTPLPGTTPFSMETSDSTPAGARVAGPASWSRLERVYPPLRDLGRPGVRIPGYAVDSDFDGLFDLHDDCPYVPLQSLLEPGVPGECAALAAGCGPGLEGVPTACGQGECASTGVCANGRDTCLPGLPSAELCDGLDNDCNGAVDDSDSDGDGVGDCADNCVLVANPLVAEDFLATNPWATLTGGQRDDDRDGYGNVCDADFTPTGTLIGTGDLTQFRASNGKSRASDLCGTTGVQPCARYDLDERGSLINSADLAVFRSLSGKAAGPKCPDCPLACSAGSDGSCD